jgi:hypothetical protein
MLGGEIAGGDGFPQRAVLPPHDVSVTVWQVGGASKRGVNPSSFDLRQGNQFQAERLRGHSTIMIGHINVHRQVGARDRDHLPPPVVHLAAWLHRDDGLGHPAPPGAGFLHGPPQPGLASSTYQVGRACGQHGSPHHRLPQIVSLGHATSLPPPMQPGVPPTC